MRRRFIIERFSGLSAIAVALALVLGSSPALAAPVNTRPVTLGSPSLQTVFNNITVAGPGINAATDQSPFALFTSDASGGAVATFVIALAGFAPNNRFGLYSANNPGIRATVFSGVSTPGRQALISFFADGRINVNGVLAASGFGSSFGFFLQGPGGIFFSEDDRNSGGNPQALIYQGDNASTLQIGALAPGLFSGNEWIVAFEDLRFAVSDRDFDDLVVLVESVTPVPEPASLLLVGSGLAGLGLGLRKRRKG